MSFDWNGNGKKDIGDRYIDYQIYKNTSKGGSSGGNGNLGCGTIALIIAAALLILYVIGVATG